MGKLKNAYIKLKNKYICYKRRKKLNHTDFTIISNNCWGGFIYQMFGLKYNTPTIGLFIMERDYVKFLANLKYYCSIELKFILPEHSKYYKKIGDVNYPIGKLNDIEVFFMHYKTREEALEKWTRRCKRINYNRMLFKMSQRNDCDDDTIRDFININHQNKICFTQAQYSIDNTVYVPGLAELNEKGGDETQLTLEYVDIYEVLNNVEMESVICLLNTKSK